MEQTKLRLQPEIWPEGMVPLRQAFLHFGLAAVGNGWGFPIGPAEIEAAIDSGSVAPRLELDRSSVVTGDVEVPMSGEEAAAFFAAPLCLSFAAAVRSGRLQAFYCAKGAGEPEPMPVAAWRTDSPFLRFRGWSYDPANPGAFGHDLPCWVYVAADDLDSVCEELRGWRMSLSDYSGGALPDDGEVYACGYPVRLVPCDEKLLVWPPRLPSLAPRLEVARPVEAAEPKPLPILTRGELQAWVRERIAAGETQTTVANSYKVAFSGKRIKQSRDDVRQIYRDEYGATKGELRPGPR